MKYLCLVYLDEKRLDELPDEDCVAYDTGYGRAATASPRKPCSPSRLPPPCGYERRCAVTDGPFAETKEQLAGFYMIEARDLNEAIQIAVENSRRHGWAASKCGRSGRFGKRSPQAERSSRKTNA